MEDFNNTNFNDSDFYDLHVNNSSVSNISFSDAAEVKEALFIFYVMTCVIVSIGFPLTLVAIYSLYSQVRNNHVAPIYVINLLVSDLIQFCCMIITVAQSENMWIHTIYFVIYYFGLMASVGFMVCIALERYLVIAWPLWYHFKRNIKSTVVVCVVVWTLPLVSFLIFFLNPAVSMIIQVIFLLLPLPLFIFFLVGTLKALSAAISVPADEKRRIVAVLVVVLFTYTLLFLPITIIKILFICAREDHRPNTYHIIVSFTFLLCSPLADLVLYVFTRKGAVDKLLASLRCCRMDTDDTSRSAE